MGIFKKMFGKKDEPQPQVQGLDLGAVIEQAKAMQQEGIQMMQVQVQGGNVSDLMAQATQLTGAPGEPRTQFVKKTSCHNCGSAKTLAPKTAYVYCDFCGSLIDYDFQKACENPQSAMPGPAYEQMARSLQADIAAAKQSQDREQFKAIQTQLFSKWVELCPNAVSPRAKNDADYRTQLVEYMAECATVNEFDETYRRFAEQVATQTKAIQWTGMFPKTVASGPTFWPIYETVKQQVNHSFGLLATAGVVAKHPDQAPEDLQKRMTWSMFCQGWLPVLEGGDGERMVADAGLKGEYSKLEPIETTTRHCGVCGGELHTLPGSKTMLCEDCGTHIDVGNPEVNCSNCGGMISFPVGRNRQQCPFCKSEALRMSW